MLTITGPSTTFVVLGTIAVRSEGRHRTFVGRQRLLLAQLLVERGRIVSTERLAWTLWEDDVPSDPGAALRSQLSRLRRMLPAGALVTDREGYGLDVERSDLDATRFEDLVGASELADAPTALGFLDDALSLWHGAAFGPVADREFALVEAARLDDMRLRARERRGELLLETGEVVAAADALAGVVHEHPEREHARALLMRALYEQGRHTDALDVYQRWRTELVERGLEPSEELRGAEQSVLTHQIVPRPTASGPGALPRPVTTFVGRETEVPRIVGLIGDSRLVTLTGPGGVGKTRLASEAAGRLIDGGAVVHFCDLAAIGRDAQVVRAVAIATGSARSDARSREDHLLAHLADKQIILLLDNCEHVMDGVARLADRLVHHTDGVRVMATSREPLRVDGEVVVPVTPLGTGSDSAALELFVDRARTANPVLHLGPNDVADVERICARLDGLPLAIELAAGRLRTMTSRELAVALESGFELLDGGPRTNPRHQSLRSVIDWSYSQLDRSTAQLFETLSVFAGGFDIDAADVVAAPNVRPGAHVAGDVAKLVDCSLLSVRRTGDATTYRMLETLRSYARDRLDAGERGVDVRDRHATWVLSFAESVGAVLRGPDEREAVDRIHRYFDDLRRAHEWLVGRDIERALQLSVALHPFAMWRGHSEVFEWAETAVAAAGGTRTPLLTAALGCAAMGRVQRGELDEAEAAAEMAIRTAFQPSTAWIAREALADVKLLRGDVAEAAALYVDCHGDAKAHDDAPQAVWSLGSAALAHLYGGRTTEAAQLAAATAREADESRNPSALSFAHFVIGEIAAATGEADAEAHLHRAIAIASTCDSHFVEGIARVTLATLQADASDTADALDHYAVAVEQWGRHNTWAPQWVTLRHLVDVLARHGAVADAAVLYGAVTSTRTGAPAFGSDARLLAGARKILETELGATDFDRAAAYGASLAGEDVVTTALQAIDALRRSLARAAN